MGEMYKDTTKSTSQIRREIEATRADMHETVDALERKLSPGQLLDQVWNGVGRNGGRAVGSAVRRHPVPLALIGAGLVWFALERTRDRGESYDTEYDYGADASSSPFEQRSTEDASSDPSLMRRAKDKVAGAWEATRVRQGFWAALERQPLALGAVAFGLGLAGGLATPATRWEDRVVGQRAEAARDGARARVREVGERAQRVAKDTAHAAREAAQREADELKSSLHRVADGVRTTARESARDEGFGSAPAGGSSRP